MKARKILILGSDFGTLDMALEAKNMGLYVITADLMETSPTKEVSDEKWLISTTDIDNLEQLCIKNNISAVVTGASDFNTGCSRELCKRLNLPYYASNDEAWEISRDKRRFKDVCKKVGAPVANDYYLTDDLSNDELDKVIFPIVVKPVDKSGNRGMSYCSNKEDLVEAYKKAREISSNCNIIVERQLEGPVFAVNYLVADGKLDLLYFCDEHHQTGEAANTYSIMYLTSHHLMQYKEELDEYVRKVLQEVGCTNGLVWVECMRDKDGHFYLLEMGYRYGGEMLYGNYEKVCGFNAVRWMLEVALGVKHTIADFPHVLDNQTYKSTVGSYFLFTKKDGKVVHLSGLDAISKIPGVFIDMPKRIGNNVRANACMGIIRVFGETVEEMCRKIDMVNQLLEIKDVEGDDLIVRFTDYQKLIDSFNCGLMENGAIS